MYCSLVNHKILNLHIYFKIIIKSYSNLTLHQSIVTSGEYMRWFQRYSATSRTKINNNYYNNF